jgi:hypothetical protein
MFAKTNLPVFLAVLTLCGCVQSHKTVVNQTSCVAVSFQNETASKIFHEAVHRFLIPEEREESTTSFSIPFLYEYERKVVRGSGHAFNKAVLLCDTNHDGHITEREARIFAGNTR